MEALRKSEGRWKHSDISSNSLNFVPVTFLVWLSINWKVLHRESILMQPRPDLLEVSHQVPRVRSTWLRMYACTLGWSAQGHSPALLCAIWI